MIDIPHIASSCKLYNLHTHTQFCDAHAPMEDFVTTAIDAGFTHLGFSPHGPVPFETNFNMAKADVPSYINEIERLRKKYGDKINIYASMEIDYLGDYGPSNSFFDTIPLDYRIGSIHFIPAFDNPNKFVDIYGNFDSLKVKMGKYFHNDVERVVRTFYSQSMAMIEKGGFHMIGHFDKFGYNASMLKPGIEQEPWYKKLELDEFQSIMDHHLIVEINTKAWEKHQRFYPDARLFALLKKYKAPVVFNSDAHSPSKLNAGRLEAMKMYENA